AVTTDLRPDFLLFSESPSRVLLAVPASRVADVMALAEERGVPCAEIGETGGEDLVIMVNGQAAVTRALKELKDAWTHAIPARMNG
ncbi:AIR synthase-related protein, partial [Calditerricola satsumensis]